MVVAASSARSCASQSTSGWSSAVASAAWTGSAARSVRRVGAGRLDGFGGLAGGAVRRGPRLGPVTRARRAVAQRPAAVPRARGGGVVGASSASSGQVWARRGRRGAGSSSRRSAGRSLSGPRPGWALRSRHPVRGRTGRPGSRRAVPGARGWAGSPGRWLLAARRRRSRCPSRSCVLRRSTARSCRATSPSRRPGSDGASSSSLASPRTPASASSNWTGPVT